MPFIRTETGDYVNVREVALIRQRDGSALLYGRDLPPDTVAAGDIDAVARALLPVTPPAPGFFTLRASWDAVEGLRVRKSPIVAGRVDIDRAWPVTPEGPDSDAAILCPDGSVIASDQAEFRSEKEWRASLI